MSKSKYERIRLEVTDHVGWLTFNHAETSNAYTPKMGEELLDAWAELEDDQVRSIVITGEGKNFCTGLDPNDLKDHLEDCAKIFSKMSVYLHGVISTMRRLPKPIIAAVNGPAAGAGFSLALASDFILASDKASFAMSYVNYGCSPDGGATFFLTRLVGPARAAELIMTGKTIGPKKAFEWGLVSGLIAHENLITEAKAFAQYFAQGPILALGRSKRLIEQARAKSLEDQLEEERHSIIASVKTEDFKEGLKSIFEKRKPKFEGK